MRMVIFVFFGTIYVTICGQNIAPTIISTSGDRYQSENFELQFTIGEVLVSDLQLPTGSLGQGFHQATAGTAIATAAQYSQFDPPMVLFPNPVTDQIFIGETPYRQLDYFISNSVQVVTSKTRWKPGLTIPVRQLAPGYYWITFMDNGNRSHSQAFIKLEEK